MNEILLIALVAVAVAQQGGQRCLVPGNLGFVCQCVATQAECAASTCIDFIPVATNLVTATDQCAGSPCPGFCCAYAGCSGLRGSAGFQNNPGTPGTGGHTAGTAGAGAGPGTAGLVAVAGFDGARGTIGTTGTSGEAGTSAAQGDAGIYGLDGFNAGPGTPGTAGLLGTIGTFGTLGTDGTAGSPGTGGTAGTAGTAASGGTSGVATAGTSGTAGVAGTAATFGTAGTAGAGLGTRGTAATAGATQFYAPGGTYGTTGTAGTGGTIGATSGAAGTSGTAGIVVSGTSGAGGSSGTSGTAGSAGTAGTVGTSGSSGTSGFSGVNGFDGVRGGVCQGAQSLQIRSSIERVQRSTSFSVEVVIAQPGFPQPTNIVQVKLNIDSRFVPSNSATFNAQISPAGVVVCTGDIRTFVCAVPVGVSSFTFIVTSGTEAGVAKITANVFNLFDRDCNFAAETVRIVDGKQRFECGCESAGGSITFSSTGCVVTTCATRRRSIDEVPELFAPLEKRAVEVPGQRITGYVSVTYNRVKKPTLTSSSDSSNSDSNSSDRCGPHVSLLADGKPIWSQSQSLYGASGVVSGEVSFQVPLDKLVSYVVAVQTPHCADFTVTVLATAFSFRPTSASTILVDADAPLASLRGLVI